MGSQYVDGAPGWGDIFSNIMTGMQAAPGQALQQMDLVDKIKRERAAQAAGVATGQAYERTLPKYGPTTEFNPVAPTVDEQGRWSTEPVMDAPANIPQTWTDPEGAQKFSNTRDLYAKLGMQAAMAGKTNEIPGLVSYGQVATTGVPEDAAARSQLEFGTTGKIREDKPQNYIAIGPDGTRVKAWSTIDGKTDQFSGEPIKAPPGSTLMLAGASEANPQPINRFKDGGSKVIVDNAMNVVGNGGRLTPDQARDTAFALSDMGYAPKSKETKDGAGNPVMMHGFMENEIPPALQPLVQHLNQTLFPQTPQAPAAGAVPYAGVSGPGDALRGGAAAPAASVAAAPAAAAPAAAAAPTSLFPPMTTEPVLRGSPSTGEQTKEVRAVAQATSARQTLEQLMTIDPATGQPRAKPYVPSLALAVLNEKAGGSVGGRYLVGKLDPTAKAYFTAAKQWVEPVLRMASGAAIRDTEYADYYGMFIPEAGDPQTVIQQKLGAMKLWENATANAATSGEALNMMDRAAAGNPMIRQAVERIRVKAQEAGTLNTPIQRDAAAAQAAPAAPVAPAAVNHDEVRRILGM